MMSLMATLAGFDPIKFLGIQNLTKDRNIASVHLLSKISQYILVRTVGLLSENDIRKLRRPEDVFILAKNKIVDYDVKLKIFLEDFKKEFYKNIKT